MNYTGDRFCFGIAAARARNEYGLDVKLVVVSDDVAIPDAKQKRGLGGTLFALKTAGAAAAAGLDAAAVEAETLAAARAARSLGVSFSTCTKPGETPKERMAEDEMEVGLGIHGEPGFQKTKVASADGIAKLMADGLKKTVDPKADLAVAIGNLGAVPPIEMSVFANGLLKYLPKAKLVIGPAAMLTSLDMNGVQVSIMELGPGMEQRLVAPTAARAWPGAVAVNTPKLVPVPLRPPPPPERAPKRDAAVEAKIRKACEVLIRDGDALDEIDKKVGDGDCGSTMKKGAQKVIDILTQPVSTDRPKPFLTAIGGQLDKLGGSSGVLLSIMFTQMAGCIEDDAPWTSKALAEAFVKGVDQLMTVGGARPGMRTMVDVLEPVAKAMAAGKPPSEWAALAQEKADATAGILSTSFGRSMYLNEDSLRGVKDPGCIAAALVFASLAGLDVPPLSPS
eukprot:SRR837773.9491.p1 GENE.SRR837773.9491~~SRR837773.9491.p1  ORF type:complete len:462 (-),score=112.12 SRR837773.9491:101-1453(-)